MATQTAIPRTKSPIPEPVDADAVPQADGAGANGHQVAPVDAALKLADSIPIPKPSASQTEIAIPGANGHPVMYSDGLPSLNALDSWYVNYIYPPTAGDPMPGGIPHQDFFLTIGEFFKRVLGLMGVPALTFGDVNIYYRDEYGQLAAVAPDACVILGVEAENLEGRESYFIETLDKPPDLVLEIASPSTSENDIEAKPEIYAYIAVSEYWMADPTGGKRYGAPLIGLKLVDGEYVEIEIERLPDGGLRGYSEVLQTYLYWKDNEVRLRHPHSGQWMRTPLELERDNAEAEARAIAAEARADAEAKARADADAEIAALRKRLKKLGLLDED